MRRISRKGVRPVSRYEGVCRVYGLTKGAKEPELLIDLTDARDEIYELMLV